MNGRDALLKLSGLLRLGADTARAIASVQLVDAQEICDLARRAEEIAVDLEALINGREQTTSISSAARLN